MVYIFFWLLSKSVGKCSGVVVVSGMVVIGGSETPVEAIEVRESVGGGGAGMYVSKLAPVHAMGLQLTLE